ncbi:hypothetical protein [Shewanella sp. UCD-KL12]|uniref:hypothetical protein n=1 Tax=Shewanella sp. UCD-KL12 TaxID=1917163 RepID=UPI00097142CE|nr:hypothetical protein [Shewanella sp. UCD-KL12]
MKKLVLGALLTCLIVAPSLHAENLLKDAVRFNRDVKQNKWKYKHKYQKAERKVHKTQDGIRDFSDGTYVDKHMDKLEHNAARKIDRAKDKLDPRDEIADEMRREINKRKREAVDNWLAD